MNIISQHIPTSHPQILIFVTGDFTRLKSGSHIRFTEMIDFALDQFNSVAVYSYSNNVTDPWDEAAIDRFHDRFPRALLILDKQTSALKLVVRLKNFLLMRMPSHAERILALRLPRHAPAYAAFLNGSADIRYSVHFADGLCELNGVPVSEVIVDTHDSKFVRYAKSRELPLHSNKSLARLRSEIGMLTSVKAVIAISTTEAGFFRTLLGDRSVLHIPSFYVPSHEVRRPSTNPKIDLLFVGARNRFNSEGIRAFIAKSATLLERYTLHIAGSVCNDEALKQLAAPYLNVHLLGWVDDLSALYEQAKAVVAPVDGTGLNIKVVEALQHGKPVFASAHARRALPDGYQRCVFPLEPDLLKSLLDRHDQRRDAENAALLFARGAPMIGEIETLRKILAG